MPQASSITSLPSFSISFGVKFAARYNANKGQRTAFFAVKQAEAGDREIPTMKAGSSRTSAIRIERRSFFRNSGVVGRTGCVRMNSTAITSFAPYATRCRLAGRNHFRAAPSITIAASIKTHHFTVARCGQRVRRLTNSWTDGLTEVAICAKRLWYAVWYASRGT